MGRKPSRWSNLPPGMRARPRGQKIYYYLDTGAKPRREIPLGTDYILAVQKWADLTANKEKPASAVITFAAAWKEYQKQVLPTKAPQTQRDNEKESAWLLRFFDDPPAPLEAIRPAHLKLYAQWRMKEARTAAEAKNAARVAAGRPVVTVPANLGHVRANREKALFSHIWNFARSIDYTALPNPCVGISGQKEAGRDILVDEVLLRRVLAKAAKPLQFALRLADITGQRPGDVLRMNESHVADGVLHVQQGKTKAKLRIVIEGKLKKLLDEMRAYKRRLKVVHVSALLVNESGQPLTKHMLRNRFDAAREGAGIDKALFQFRDLRAKAATEADEAAGTRTAQSLLGHATEAQTADYIRHKVGKKVRLVR